MVFLLIVASVTFAQIPDTLRPLRIVAPIQLDGKLDEPSWQQAVVFDSLVQGFPMIGAAPSERTTIQILYDDEFVYVGVMAFDSLPSRIIATGLERDIYYSSDDHVSITLDTYYDQRQGTLFSTNPLSARFDEEVLENGNSFNAAYNTFWDVRSHRDENGYSVEFRIPFSSLRFEPSEKVIMGFKLVRCIKNKNEFDIFPPTDATVANAVWRVNNSQPVIFNDLRARKPFYFIPYVKADFQQTSTWDEGQQIVLRRAEAIRTNSYVQQNALDRLLSNIGFDVKYGLSKNFTLDATVNTDFAQAETDNRVLNFTRFAINLPEKRNFFLESKDYLGFSTSSGMMLFNSRTIGIEKGSIIPIIGGVRLSGKANGWQLGLLDLQTHRQNEFDVDPQHFSIVRVRKEIWGNGSFIGAIVTNRVSTNGSAFNNQVLGLDAMRRFKDNKWLANLNLAITNDQSASGFFNESSMANVSITRSTAVGFNHNASVEYTEKNFKARSGFAPDSAYVLFSATNGYIWQWKNNAKMNLYWLTHALNHRYRTINDKNESSYTDLELGTSFKNGASILVAPLFGSEYMPYVWNFRNDIFIPTNYYAYTGVRMRYDSRQTKRLNYSLIGLANGFYGGTRINLTLTGYYALNRNLRFTYRYDWNAFHFPEHYSASGASSLRSGIMSAGVAFTQSIYFSVRALVQYDNASGTIGGNFRLRYNPVEGTDLYIVYNPRVNTNFPTLEGPMRTTVDQQVIIVKFAKAISLR